MRELQLFLGILGGASIVFAYNVPDKFQTPLLLLGVGLIGWSTQ